MEDGTECVLVTPVEGKGTEIKNISVIITAGGKEYIANDKLHIKVEVKYPTLEIAPVTLDLYSKTPDG